MADRSIGADDLGAFGEAHFEKLCHSAGLVANKSYQDKMGWDYVVERTPHDEGPSLDTRQLFPLCRVQVKTVWKRDDGRVNLGLSAAERLAKPEDPAFVVAFQVEEDDDGPRIVSSHLIHLIGNELSRILKRLRATTAGVKARALQDQEITFQASKGASFGTGKELLGAFDAAIGPEPSGYRARKRNAIDSLGYDTSRYSVDFEFAVSDKDHLLDALMGRRPVELRATNAMEHRFGIGLPSGATWEVGPDKKLVAMFAPTPRGDCSIVVRASSGETVGFEGKFAHLPIPGLAIADQILLFSAPSFELEVRGSGQIALSLGGQHLEAIRLSHFEWRALFKLLRLVNAGSTLIEIRERKTGARIEVALPQADQVSHALTGEQLEALLTRIEGLWDQAGVRVPDFTGHELMTAGQAVDSLHRFWKGELLVPIAFSLPDHAQIERTELVLIRVMSVIFAGSHIAVAERLVTENAKGGPDFVELERSVATVEEIGMADDAISEFAKRIMEKLGAHGMMTLEPD